MPGRPRLRSASTGGVELPRTVLMSTEHKARHFMITSLALTQRKSTIFYVCFCLKHFLWRLSTNVVKTLPHFHVTLPQVDLCIFLTASLNQISSKMWIYTTPLLSPLLLKTIAVNRHIDCFTSAWSPIGRLDLHERPFPCYVGRSSRFTGWC